MIPSEKKQHQLQSQIEAEKSPQATIAARANRMRWVVGACATLAIGAAALAAINGVVGLSVLSAPVLIPLVAAVIFAIIGGLTLIKDKMLSPMFAPPKVHVTLPIDHLIPLFTPHEPTVYTIHTEAPPAEPHVSILRHHLLTACRENLYMPPFQERQINKMPDAVIPGAYTLWKNNVPMRQILAESEENLQAIHTVPADVIPTVCELYRAGISIESLQQVDEDTLLTIHAVENDTKLTAFSLLQNRVSIETVQNMSSDTLHAIKQCLTTSSAERFRTILSIILHNLHLFVLHGPIIWKELQGKTDITPDQLVTIVEKRSIITARTISYLEPPDCSGNAIDAYNNVAAYLSEQDYHNVEVAVTAPSTTRQP